jgi:hypothetical protein
MRRQLVRVCTIRDEVVGLCSLAQVVVADPTTAPERVIDPATADHRVDVYALGAALFELLTGTRLFEGGHDTKVSASIDGEHDVASRGPCSSGRSRRWESCAPTAYGALCVLVAALLCLGVQRAVWGGPSKRPALVGAALGSAALCVTSLLLGPFVLVPVICTASITMFTIDTPRARALLLGLFVAPMLVPWFAERLGWLAPSFAIDGAIALSPPGVAARASRSRDVGETKPRAVPWPGDGAVSPGVAYGGTKSCALSSVVRVQVELDAVGATRGDDRGRDR